MAVLNQNLSSYTAQDFEPIPPGEYDFEINDTDIVDTKTGKRMIKVACKVLGPTHAGRLVFENFLIGQDVAMIRLKTLATVSGHPRPDYIQDTQELHGLRFRGNVKIREQDGYAPQNNIASFKKIPMPTGGQPPFPAQKPPIGYAPPMPPINQTPAPLPKLAPPPVAQPPLQAPTAATGKPTAPWMK